MMAVTIGRKNIAGEERRTFRVRNEEQRQRGRSSVDGKEGRILRARKKEQRLR